MTKLVLKKLGITTGDRLADALAWQEMNSGILALLPEKWDPLSDNQKWALLRILAVRPGYSPDWLAEDLWLSLRSQLFFVSFDDETDIIAMAADQEIREQDDDTIAELTGAITQSSLEGVLGYSGCYVTVQAPNPDGPGLDLSGGEE